MMTSASNTLGTVTAFRNRDRGSLTVAGGTGADATSVTVGGAAAALYSDATFAKSGVAITNGVNVYTAIASDSLGRSGADSVTYNLPASVAFTYDNNGNLTGDGARALDYDDENQLIRVTVTNVWKSEFAYDGRMRLRVRKEFQWQSGAWAQASETRYLYDGMLPIQERDGRNMPLVTYTRGTDLSGTLQGAGGIGGLLARTDHGALTAGAPSAHACYHADGNGNITALINGAQAIVARYLYDSYGNLLAKSGPLADANALRFSSKEHHPRSGLYYYGYRFYDPNLQRWVNRDPIGEDGGVNLYGFVYNNPTDDFDEDGLAPHRKKRRSTYDKHTAPRSGRPDTKQRTKPGWISRKTGKTVKCPGALVILPAIGISIGQAAETNPFAPPLPDDEHQCPDPYTPVRHDLWLGFYYYTCELIL